MIKPNLYIESEFFKVFDNAEKSIGEYEFDVLSIANLSNMWIMRFNCIRELLL